MGSALTSPRAWIALALLLLAAPALRAQRISTLGDAPRTITASGLAATHFSSDTRVPALAPDTSNCAPRRWTIRGAWIGSGVGLTGGLLLIGETRSITDVLLMTALGAGLGGLSGHTAYRVIHSEQCWLDRPRLPKPGTPTRLRTLSRQPTASHLTRRPA